MHMIVRRVVFVMARMVLLVAVVALVWFPATIVRPLALFRSLALFGPLAFINWRPRVVRMLVLSGRMAVRLRGGMLMRIGRRVRRVPMVIVVMRPRIIGVVRTRVIVVSVGVIVRRRRHVHGA